MRDDPGNWRHICVDMQRLFAEDTPWRVDWAVEILPEVVELAAAAPERTIFTRFLTPRSVGDLPGMWQDYYRKWPMMMEGALDPALIDLVTPLKLLTPPALVFDKRVYSPWLDGRLHRHLAENRVETLVISGGETDVCVLATVLGAIDLGYRVILIKNALCSGSDPTHDATLSVIGNRFSVQADVMLRQDFLDYAGLPDRGLSGSLTS